VVPRDNLAFLALTAAAAGTDTISYLARPRFLQQHGRQHLLLGLGVATGGFPAATRSTTALGAFVSRRGGHRCHVVR